MKMIGVGKRLIPAFVLYRRSQFILPDSCSRTYSVYKVDNNITPPGKARQHVNPLASRYQQPVQLADNWVDLSYEDTSLPFHIDIGCGRGKFVFDHAGNNPGLNILGLEIRKPIAASCVQKAEMLKLKNVGFICCNVNVDMERIINDINLYSRVASVSIQFPDPYWKSKQQKRRVVQQPLVDVLGEKTDKGCMVFMQSDVKEVLEEMRDRFRENHLFADSLDRNQWLTSNPLGSETEREVAARADGLPVYRCLFSRI